MFRRDQTFEEFFCTCGYATAVCILLVSLAKLLPTFYFALILVSLVFVFVILCTYHYYDHYNHKSARQEQPKPKTDRWAEVIKLVRAKQNKQRKGKNLIKKRKQKPVSEPDRTYSTCVKPVKEILSK